MDKYGNQILFLTFFYFITPIFFIYFSLLYNVNCFILNSIVFIAFKSKYWLGQKWNKHVGL